VARHRHTSVDVAGFELRGVDRGTPGIEVACLEEIAYRKGYIHQSAVDGAGKPLLKNQYGQYLIEDHEMTDSSGKTYERHLNRI